MTQKGGSIGSIFLDIFLLIILGVLIYVAYIIYSGGGLKAALTGHMKKVTLGKTVGSYPGGDPQLCTIARYRGGIKGDKITMRGHKLNHFGGGQNITTNGCPPGVFGRLAEMNNLCKKTKNTCPPGTAACANGWFGVMCERPPCGEDSYKGGSMKVDLNTLKVTNKIKVKPYSQPLCMGNGLCMSGICKCKSPYSGTYCQYKGEHGDNPCAEDPNASPFGCKQGYTCNTTLKMCVGMNV